MGATLAADLWLVKLVTSGKLSNTMIDQDALQVATTKILLDSMSTEDRNQLLTKAIAHVLLPVRTSYGGNLESPLQGAFHTACAVVAGELVREHLHTPEVKARLQLVVTEAVEKLLSGDFAEKLSRKLSDSLWSE